MRFFLCVNLINIFVISWLHAQNEPRRATVSGYVREAGSAETLTGVNVYVPGTSVSTTTNTPGFYSLTLPVQDSLRLVFSFVGYEAKELAIRLRTNTTLTVSLTPGRVLSEVNVRAGRNEKVSESTMMSRIDVPIAQIKKIPAFLGEKDVLRVLQLMPGVQKGSEGQTGLYVRGGGPDQNLITLDEAVVYNPSHLFGFFSIFNGDALKSVELTKGGFPARYGGRLSSVLELTTKEGNHEKLHGEASIGLIASRLTLEGPLTKPRKDGRRPVSFLVSGRRTYFDAILGPIINARTNGQTKGGYYFYDLNAKVNYDVGPNDKLSLSGYVGRDHFRRQMTDEGTNIGLGWGNATGTLHWNHLFGQKWFSRLSLLFSRYDLQIASDRRSEPDGEDIYSLRYGSRIRDLSAKYDLDFYPTPAHSLRLGMQSTYHRFVPSAVVTKNTDIHQHQRTSSPTDALESGLYLEDDWRPGGRWRLNGGLRLSHFGQGRLHYLLPEPRLSLAHTLRPDLSVKASYALMNQYVHLLSSTGIGLPTDLWVPTTQRVKPQRSQQAALGLAKDFAAPQLALTVEGYYKTMNNLINYKEGSSFTLTDTPNGNVGTNWQDHVTAGRGWSYGLETLLQRKTGRLSGWAGYTLSWTRWQFNNLNGGRPFYPRYDRRHDVSVVGIYELTKRITLSGTWVYGTGNALTMPMGRFNAYQPSGAYPYDGKGNLFRNLFQDSRMVQDYGLQKNSFRAEAYHRLDLSVHLHRKKKTHERTWQFNLYNAYNRRNPFFYQLEWVKQRPNQPRRMALMRYSVFPVIPSCSYAVTF